MYVGRFAPSPTGPLHFGSLVTAVASYLDARDVGDFVITRADGLIAYQLAVVVDDAAQQLPLEELWALAATAWNPQRMPTLRQSIVNV